MLQAELDMLVIRAQQGDEPALLLLFQHYQPGLLQFAYRLVREHSLAQDAVQNAWLKTVSSLRSLHNPLVFKSWIYRSVKWSATDLLRQQQVQQQRFTEQPVEDLAAEAEPSQDELMNALQTLPTDEYQAIYLFYFA